MNSLILSFVALIPVVILCWYIYSKDRMEKEPTGLLFLLLFAGVISSSISLKKYLNA